MDGSAILTAIVPMGSTVTPEGKPLRWSSPGMSVAGKAAVTGEWGMKAMTSTANGEAEGDDVDDRRGHPQPTQPLVEPTVFHGDSTYR